MPVFLSTSAEIFFESTPTTPYSFRLSCAGFTFLFFFSFSSLPKIDSLNVANQPFGSSSLDIYLYIDIGRPGFAPSRISLGTSRLPTFLNQRVHVFQNFIGSFGCPLGGRAGAHFDKTSSDQRRIKQA